MLGIERLEAAMQRALSLASLGPAGDLNPQVGCVLLDSDGITVAEGWHRGAGTPHAEVNALSQLPDEWRGRERELTAVVTLEPCNHTGLTGPCAVALRDAGIGAVAYALRDPSPVAGGGAETLRGAGVKVVGGVLADEARELLGPWLARQGSNVHDVPESTQRNGSTTYPLGHNVSTRHNLHPRPRPHVTVKWAQTLDGRAAAADGSSQWITGKDARADVHRRRAEADAILVGTGTLYADNPALTARADLGGLLVPAEEQPIPVVLGRREIPQQAQINSHPALAAKGLANPLQFDGDDLVAHLAELHSRGMSRLFVEGGPAVASSFIKAGFADEVLIYLAPALLGGPRLALGDLGVEHMGDIKRLRVTHFAQLGQDLLIKATFEGTTDAPEATDTPDPDPQKER